MNGYEVYCHYQAVKLHFDSKTYDYFKYNGKTSTTVAAFERRKDKYLFHKISRKIKDDEMVPFLVSNFLLKQKTWTRELVEPAAYDTYLKWKQTHESLTYSFDQDIQKILSEGSIDDMLSANKDKGYPRVFTMMNQSDITTETVVILNALTGCIAKWDKVYGDDFYYMGVSNTLKKYAPFLHLDLPIFKKIAQKHLTPQPK